MIIAQNHQPCRLCMLCSIAGIGYMCVRVCACACMCMYVCACVRVCACMRMRVRVSQDILHSYMIAVLLNDFEDLESTGFIILKLQC